MTGGFGPLEAGPVPMPFFGFHGQPMKYDDVLFNAIYMETYASYRSGDLEFTDSQEDDDYNENPKGAFVKRDGRYFIPVSGSYKLGEKRYFLKEEYMARLVVQEALIHYKAAFDAKNALDPDFNSNSGKVVQVADSPVETHPRE